MAQDNYEVYYHQSGRWQLHASFEASQRELAIEEAIGVEQKEGYGTRVVRTTFNDETNTSEEIITWQSAKAKTINDADSMFGPKAKTPPSKLKKQNAPQPQQRQARQPDAAPRPEKPRPAPPPRVAAKAPPKPKRKTKKKRSGIVRFLIALIASLGFAIVSSAAMALVIAQMMSMGMLPPANRLPLIVGTFVLVFFFSVFINLQKQFDIIAFLRRSGESKRGAAPAGPAQMMAKTKAPVQDIEFDQVEIEDIRESGAAEEAAEQETAEEEPELQDLGADMDAEVGGAPPELEPEPEPAPQQHPQPQQQPAPQAAPEKPKAEEKKPAAPKAPERTPAENDARHGLGAFVNDTMRHVRLDHLNAFSKFGLNLYMAGGASVIGQAKRLPKDKQLMMLKEGLMSVGNAPDRAENFCIELPTYGKNPRYAGMVKAGAEAMTQHMGGNTGAVSGIAALLNEWNLPEKRPTVPSVFTFVFTDIVGSTAMTQRLGNAGAQKAVRAHNTAVRDAIQAMKGREVKHTGDGIMATFPDPVAAVMGAIRMQREIFAHNAANPQVEVTVRIGINVGEAVEEENDFFGAAVQMTARICDKATKGNIWASQAVVDACKGQKIGFIPRGKFEMKGIQGSKPLYEIGWSDAHKNELADL